MCQMSVLMDNDGEMQLVMKNVSELEVTDGGVMLSMMFEKPQEIKGATIKRIDFSEGKVFLIKKEKG